jgi:hypothetical protein
MRVGTKSGTDTRKTVEARVLQRGRLSTCRAGESAVIGSGV